MKTILVVQYQARGRQVFLSLKEKTSRRLLTELSPFMEENSGEIFIF